MFFLYFEYVGLLNNLYYMLHFHIYIPSFLLLYYFIVSICWVCYVIVHILWRCIVYMCLYVF